MTRDFSAKNSREKNLNSVTKDKKRSRKDFLPLPDEKTVLGLVGKVESFLSI